MEYLNVTDSNKPYPYVLDGCPAFECPLDIFTSIYQPRFPASVDVECAKQTPPTPPSKFILLFNSINSRLLGGDGHNTKLIVVLSVVIVGLGIIIVATVVYLYQRKRKQGPFLLSSSSSSEIP